jgi:hypothetical protein
MLSSNDMESWFIKRCADESFRSKYITIEVALNSMQYIPEYSTVVCIYKSIHGIPHMKDMLINDYKKSTRYLEKIL